MSRMSVSLTHDDPKRKKIFLSLVAFNALCFFGIGTGVLAYVLTEILNIETPPSDALFLLNITWFLVLFTPFSFVISLAGTWVSFGLRRYRRAYIFAAFPLINIIGAPLSLQLAHVT